MPKQLAALCILKHASPSGVNKRIASGESCIRENNAGQLGVGQGTPGIPNCYCRPWHLVKRASAWQELLKSHRGRGNGCGSFAECSVKMLPRSRIKAWWFCCGNVCVFFRAPPNMVNFLVASLKAPQTNPQLRLFKMIVVHRNEFVHAFLSSFVCSGPVYGLRFGHRLGMRLYHRPKLKGQGH